MRRAALRKTACLAHLVALSGAAFGCQSAVHDFYDPLTGGGSGTTSGTGGALPSDCQGDPTKDPSIVRDDCGLFVDAATATNGDGTKAAPFKTLGEAIAKGAARIFVCAGDYTETATLEIGGGVELYGAFGACPGAGDWTWSADARASLSGAANKPVMRFSSGTAASALRGFNITAANATDPGASSIGVVADGAELVLEDVTITAGDGARGADGVLPSGDAMAGIPGVAGSATDACALQPTGGSPGATMCDGVESKGGDGGVGGLVPSNNGMPGVDGSPMDDLGGKGGAVDLMTGVCAVGQNGHDGAPGDPGKGGVDKGTLTSNGVAGGNGEDGMAGSPAQGGGGGGGAKAGLFCKNGVNTIAGPGASGGGGGSGGCGGKGGQGGKAGGSSIAVVSLNAKLTLKNVTLQAGKGGDGGNGSSGKAGALGGGGGAGGMSSGLSGSKPGCKGGDGGQGGDGGFGGGARGGHSTGIAYTGDAPPVGEDVTSNAGTAGIGGTSNPAMPTDGSPGTAAVTIDFN